MSRRDFRISGHGSDLAIEMRGPDLATCLDAGVAGFGAALAQVAEEAPRRRHSILVEGEAPAERLVGLFDELVAVLDIEGLLPVGLTDLRVGESRWEAVVEAVSLDPAEVHGVAPKAATWHEASLAEVDRGWVGRVTLDL